MEVVHLFPETLLPVSHKVVVMDETFRDHAVTVLIVVAIFLAE